MSLKRLVSFMALVALSVMAIGAPVAQASHDDDTMATAECVLDANGVAGTAVGGNGVNSVFQDTTWGGAWDALEQMDTDPGRFNFSGTAQCEGTDRASEAGNPGPESIPLGQYNIIASGDFDNLICGTGTANGDAVIRGPVGTSPPTVQIFTEFGINFIGGVGGSAAGPFQGKLVFTVDADEGDANGDGVVTTAGGQIETKPDGAENWPLAAMNGEYALNGGHSYANTAVNENQIDGGMGTGDITITPTPDQNGNGGHCVETTNDGLDGNVRAFFVNGKFDGILSGEGSDDSQPQPGQPPTNLDSDG